MIAFTTGEILLSVIYALIFGAGFAVLTSAVDMLLGVALTLPTFAREVFCFDRILPPPKLSQAGTGRKKGALYIFLCVILFAIGFSLLSYVSLDGQIRIYMLALAFASFYLSKSVFCDFLTKLFLSLFKLILSGLTVVLRLIISPFFIILKAVKKADTIR